MALPLDITEKVIGRVVQGKVRKYYTATESGEQALRETLPRLRELVDEVLEGKGPTALPDPPDESEEP